MLEDLIKKVKYDDFAIVGDGASEQEINKCQHKLKQSNLPTLPDDYINLLKMASCISFDGCEFFSINDNPPTKFAHTPTTIIDGNSIFKISESYENCVVIGQKDEDILAYDKNKSTYKIIDAIDHETISETSDIADFLNMTIIARL